jgi:hypothetical protein
MLSRRSAIAMGVCVLLALIVTSAPSGGGAQQPGPDKYKFAKDKFKFPNGKRADEGPPFDQGGGKKAVASKKPLLILQERVDMDKFQQPMTLKDALELLHKDLAARGMELDIVVDVEVFKAEAPDAADIYDTQIRLQPLPRKLTVAMLLRQLLNRIPSGNASYVVFGDHVLVTTASRTGIDSLLLQHVGGLYEARPLGQLLRDLAEKTGTTIVVDKRVGDKEERAVTVIFQQDATLAGALRVVTEMVDLKAVVLDGIIFVTTPAHAEQLRKEQKQQEKDRHLLWPISEYLDTRPPAPPVMQPGLPGFPGMPSIDPLRPAPTPLDAPPLVRREAAAAA